MKTRPIILSTEKKATPKELINRDAELVKSLPKGIIEKSTHQLAGSEIYDTIGPATIKNLLSLDNNESEAEVDDISEDHESELQFQGLLENTEIDTAPMPTHAFGESFSGETNNSSACLQPMEQQINIMRKKIEIQNIEIQQLKELVGVMLKQKFSKVNNRMEIMYKNEVQLEQEIQLIEANELEAIKMQIKRALMEIEK